MTNSHGICAAQGFSATGIYSGLKKSQKLDLALIYSQVPAIAAGVFTQNKVKAAPLILSQKHVKKGLLQAVIINSGNANACTGRQGSINAKLTVVKLASDLNITESLIGIASTGVIGVQLPINKILDNIPKLCNQLSTTKHTLAAQAIMTTDTFVKEADIKIKLSDGKVVTIGGMAKGSGMIHPNMATMLGFITTDIAITKAVLDQSLKLVTQNSFNMISVDGDSSTNDMVLIMANGLANNQPITDLNSPDGQIFYQGLLEIATLLAKQIAKDGEGASKLIEVNVNGAKTDKQAKTVAKSVVSSTLVKAAIFGNDANWGRIACAVGYADNGIKPTKLKIALGDITLFNHGVPIKFSEDKALTLLSQNNVYIHIDLGIGDYKSTAWGCDLSYDYVKINASYRS